MLGKMEPVGETVGLIPYSFKGTSMLPTFLEGDQLVATPYSGIEDIQPGDVVIYKPVYFLADDRNICHRVVSVDLETGEIITKGDNNQEIDKPLQFEDIQGKVINATRPARIERFIVYNQYDRECREFVEALQQKEEEDRRSMADQLAGAMDELKNSQELLAYEESQTYTGYTDGLIDYIDENKTKEEIIALKNLVEESPEYQAFRVKSDDLQIKELQDQIDTWKPTMVNADNPEVREMFPSLEAFPVVILNVPDYFDGKEFVSAKQEYLNKAVTLEDATVWEEGKRASIKTIMEARPVSIQLPAQE